MSQFSPLSVAATPDGMHYVFTLAEATVRCRIFLGSPEQHGQEKSSFFEVEGAVGIAGEVDSTRVIRCYCLKADGILVVAVSFDGALTWQLHEL